MFSDEIFPLIFSDKILPVLVSDDFFSFRSSDTIFPFSFSDEIFPFLFSDEIFPLLFSDEIFPLFYFKRRTSQKMANKHARVNFIEVIEQPLQKKTTKFKEQPRPNQWQQQFNTLKQ